MNYTCIPDSYLSATPSWWDDEPDYETCDACNGTGVMYYDISGDTAVVITKEQYLQNADDDDFVCDTCETCKGEGEILHEFEYERDYDSEIKEDKIRRLSA